MNLWGGGRPTPALSVEVEAIAPSRRWVRAFDPFTLGGTTQRFRTLVAQTFGFENRCVGAALLFVSQL
jgi:hypothetical protein